MRILITGGGGFLGGKLARALQARGALRGQGISSITLADVRAPVSGGLATGVACDISDPDQVSALIKGQGPFDVVFHLAAVVSAAAEADFDLGLRVNLMGTLTLFQGLRQAGGCPVVVYASSIAAHGGEAPGVIVDGVELNPQSSYGAQKVMGELLLTDMSRRGFLDGRGLRLPTVIIRPGKANAAASSFMSAIFRDTLQGGAANCPVGEDFVVFHSAPRVVVGNLIHGAELAAEGLGPNRCFNLPGRSDSIGEMIAAMSRIAGPEAAARITWNKDPAIERIVGGWRNRVVAEKALGLGFAQDRSFGDSVRWFLNEDVVAPT